MKAILISDHAKWCAKMMNGEKNIEVRKGTALYKATKKLIDEYGYAEFYVYCTKGKSLIYTDGTDGKSEYVDYKYYESYKGDKNDIGSGKVIFKFRCYKVEEIKFFEEYVCPNGYEDYDGEWVDTSEIYRNVHEINNETLQKTCLVYEELQNYLGNKNGCAIHISDLEIFDKPKELSEFKIPCDFRCPELGCCYCHKNTKLTKAPQSFMYVEVENE